MNYTFDPFLATLHRNWYEDDDLLRRLLARYMGAAAREAEGELGDMGAQCAGTLRELAETSARTEHRPSLRHFDGYGRRIDEIVLPASTSEALRIVEGRHRLAGC